MGMSESEGSGQVCNPGVCYEHSAAPRQEGTMALGTVMK